MKMGRPKKEYPKHRSITIRMTEATHRKLIEYAAERGMTITEVTLQSLDEYLSKAEPEQKVP